MSKSDWINGTWADVALGDLMLGADGQAWDITGGLIERFDLLGIGEVLEVTVRCLVGDRELTRSVRAESPVRYATLRADAERPRLACLDCLQRTGAHDPGNTLGVLMACEGHGGPAAAPTVERSDQKHFADQYEQALDAIDTEAPDPWPRFEHCQRCNLDLHRCPGCGEPLRHGIEVCDPCGRLTAGQHPAPIILEQESGAIDAAMEALNEQGMPDPCQPIGCDNGIHLAGCPYAAVDEPPAGDYREEQAAVTALKGAELAVQVVERVMSLADLTEHLEAMHADWKLPAQGTGKGRLTGAEYRSKLADLHFAAHEAAQTPLTPWEPRGSVPHRHPVMDRPTK